MLRTLQVKKHWEKVDKDNELEVVKEKIADSLYDMDDIVIKDMDVTRRLD